MGGVPLVETAAWIGGLVGVSAVTFAAVSFVEVKKKYELDPWAPGELPPSKSAAAEAAPKSSATLGRPLKARKAKK